MPAPLSAEPPVATSQELLRSALQRSGQRNAQVARRRLWLRWGLWATERSLRYLGLPALLAGGVLLGLDRGLPRAWLGTPAQPQLRPAAAPASAAAAVTAASRDTQQPRQELAPTPLQLRLDAGLAQRFHGPHAQSRQPGDRGSGPASTTPQENP
jgi:hypothetical protein